MLRGVALTEQGQSPEGIAQTCQGLSAFLAMGKEIVRPDLLVLLAEAHGKAEQTEDGLAVLAEALPTVERTGMHLCEAELYRLKGQLVLQSGVRSPKSEQVLGKSKTSLKQVKTSPQSPTPSTQAETEAEACFQKAIEIAQRQQAKSLELRATVSLARLWQRQGKQHEARNTLSEIYGWFTEGFDTKDLQEAKALLDSLESRV
jgi:predicted ATPase